MLTKRMLEDAAKCYIGKECKTCEMFGIFDCIQLLAQTALEYREVLDELIYALRNERRNGRQAKYSVWVLARIAQAEKMLKESEG